MDYYPAFLNLQGKKTVVIGGGAVAERKITALLRSGADVTVISPALTKRLQHEKRRKTIHHIARQYRKNDTKGAFLVIAATDSQEINSQAANHATGLVNVVDVPAECTFIAPSVIRRGALTIAVSTGGTSPALSKAVRKELEQIYGPELSGYLSFVKKIRLKALSEISAKKNRTAFLKGLASERLLKMLREKGLKSVKKKIMEELKKSANRRCQE